MKKLKERLVRFISTTHKHFTRALIIQLVVSILLVLFKVDMNMVNLEQMFLFGVIWFIIGWGYEIHQKNKGGKNTRLQMLEDSIMTGLGGSLGSLLINLIFN